MGNNNSSNEEEDEPVEQQQPRTSKRKSGIRKKAGVLFNEKFANRRTSIPNVFFLDFTPHPNAIRLSPETNELQFDIYPDIGTDTPDPKTIHLPPGTTKSQIDIRSDNNGMDFIRFNMDRRLFNDAGPLNDAIKTIMRDAGKPDILCEDPTCFFVLYGAGFKLRLIVFKLPRGIISNIKHVFERYERNDPVFDREHNRFWLRKQFQAFKLNSKNGGGKVKNREFLERQFGSKLENVIESELKQLIRENEITDFHFDAYERIYLQAVNPNEELYKRVQLENVADRRQQLDYCFSYDNFVFNGNNEQEKVSTDRKTIQELWIASSHNSYLKGRQIFYKSCALAYIKILLTGCRCIELDLWPTEDKQDILINHGNAFTEPIPFETVLKVIRVYAFKVSKYPLILSLEDRCEEDLQLKMAELFKKHLGDLLLTEELEPRRVAPELNRLMGKILIKHSALDDREREEFLILNNRMLLDETFNVKYAQNDIWHKKRVVLYNNRIEIGESEELADVQLEVIKQKPQLTDDDQLILDNIEENERRKDEQDLIREISKLDASFIEDLQFVCETDPETAHLSKEYYHGVLDAKDAIARLNAAKEVRVQSGQPVDGIFLIRRLSQLSDEYVLSVIHQGRPKHVRIRCEPDSQGQKTFSIDNEGEEYKPNKLTDLVAYYLEHEFKIGASTSKLHLGEPCERPVQTLTQQEPRPRWFFPEMSHARAHFLLQAYPEGTCLVRTEEDFNQDGYILTVRLRYVIRHFRLKQEGDKFYVHSKAFNNVEEIIEYFKRHEFEEGICLEPIYVDEMTDQTVDEMMEQYNEEIFYEGVYYEEPIKMRTVAPFIAQSLFGKYVEIPSDQLIDKLKESPSLVLFSWDFQYYFINQDLNNFWAEDFDPNAFHVFKLNGQVVKDKLREEPELPDGSERKGIELIYEETDNELQFIYNYVRFTIGDLEKRELWVRSVNEQIEQTNRILSIKDEDLEPSKKGAVHPEMSKLAIYFKNYKFKDIDGDDITYYNKVCSINNHAFSKLKAPLNEYNAIKMSRIYPYGIRILSGNYDPIICWNAGCQMVALNYQTDGKKMLKNYGRFLSNGGCGYVAKPDYLKTPITAEKTANRTPKYLTIKVIGGRNLSRLFEHSSGICSPMVEFWLDERKRDQDYQKTKGVRSNGLNPVWKDQNVSFEIRYSELALIRLQVIDADYIGWVNLNYDLCKSPARAQFVGQASFPFNGLQTGIKSIPLLNNFNTHLEMSSLLVEIEISNNPPPKKQHKPTKPAETRPSVPPEKRQRPGPPPKHPEPMEIDPDQPGPSTR